MPETIAWPLSADTYYLIRIGMIALGVLLILLALKQLIGAGRLIANRPASAPRLDQDIGARSPAAVAKLTPETTRRAAPEPLAAPSPPPSIVPAAPPGPTSVRAEVSVPRQAVRRPPQASLEIPPPVRPITDLSNRSPWSLVRAPGAKTTGSPTPPMTGQAPVRPPAANDAGEADEAAPAAVPDGGEPPTPMDNEAIPPSSEVGNGATDPVETQPPPEPPAPAPEDAAMPAETMRARLLAALEDAPAIRDAIRLFKLPEDAARWDDDQVDEAVRIAGCREWLAIVGAPDEQVRFILSQLGGSARAPEARLVQMIRAFALVAPPVSNDTLSKSATRLLVEAMAGADAAVVWPDAGASVHRVRHQLRDGRPPPERAVIAAVRCPGIATPDRVVLPAIVDVAAPGDPIAPPNETRSRPTPLLNLLHGMVAASAAADARGPGA